MQRLISLILVFLLCLTINIPLFAQEIETGIFQSQEMKQKNDPQEVIEEIIDNFERIKDFRGSLVSKIFLEKEAVTYKINLMKNPHRSLIDNSYTFGQVRGTKTGRLLNVLPWIYLPPNCSLLQNVLPLSGQRDYLKPLNNLEDIYNLKFLGEAKLHNKSVHLLELSNLFTKQILWVEKERLLINRIEVFNGANNLVATINYNGYRELADNVWLPNLIQVKDKTDEKILEINYQNWVINDGLNNEDFVVGFAPQVRQKISKLKKKVSSNSNDDKSRYHLAKLYYEILETDKAVEMLQQALNIKQRIEYYWKLAEVYREQGEYNKAVRAIKDALTIDYKRGRLHYTLGELNLQLQNIDQARNSFETAVNLEPTNKKYLERLFLTYRRSSITDTMLKNAQNTLDKLIELAPNKAKYQIYSGDLHLEVDEYRQAAYRYQKAIQITPEDSWGYVKLAKCYEKIDRYRLAEQLYKMVIKLEDNWLNYERLGEFYYRWKNYSSAINNYRKALDMKPKQFDLKVKLGKAYWLANKKDKAFEIWGKILKADGLKLNDYVKIGRLFTNYKLDDLAVSTYRQGIKKYSDSVDSWSKKLLAKLHGRLARLYNKQQNYKLASKEYQNSIELHPYSWVYKDLGTLKFRQGDLTEAINLWQEVKRKDAGNLDVVYNLAIAQIVKTNFNKAEDNLEYIKRFNPDQRLDKLVQQANRIISSIKDLEMDEDQPGQKYKLEGDKLRKQGKVDLAVKKYQAALEQNAYYGSVYFHLGVLQSVKGNYQQVKGIISRFNNDYFHQSTGQVLKELKELIKEVNNR